MKPTPPESSEAALSRKPLAEKQKLLQEHIHIANKYVNYEMTLEDFIKFKGYLELGCRKVEVLRQGPQNERKYFDDASIIFTEMDDAVARSIAAMRLLETQGNNAILSADTALDDEIKNCRAMQKITKNTELQEIIGYLVSALKKQKEELPAFAQRQIIGAKVRGRLRNAQILSSDKM